MSGIKGYSTQKKETSKVPPYTDAQTQDTSDFVTISRNVSGKVALDTKAQGAFRVSGALATEANSTERVIICTAHGGSVGDFIRFESSAANPYFEAGILSIPDANTIILDTKLPAAPVLSDDFFILRYITQRMDASGGQIVVTTQGPTQFVLDSVDTVVSQDTGTPANSDPFPIAYLNTLGVREDLATEASLAGLATEATLVANGVLAGAVNETAPVTDTASSGLNGRLQRIAQRITALIALFPLSLGQKTMAASFAVTMASDQTAVPTNQAQPTTGTNSSVAASATSVTILALNASRKGASVYNDSSAILYLALAASASSTSFTVKLYPEAYYELPNDRVYTGIITGIWASATGSARVSEMT